MNRRQRPYLPREWRGHDGRLVRLLRAAVRITWLAAVVLSVASCTGSAIGDSLLLGLPACESNFADPDRLTDGRVPPDGSAWRSDLTATSQGPSFAEFDLGATRRIAAAWIQADHNEAYVLSTSPDGENFTEFWRAGPVKTGGMRARHAGALDVEARFVRVDTEGGDGAYSIGEVMLFERRPGIWPPAVARTHPTPPNERVRLWLSIAAALTSLWLILLPRGASGTLVLLSATIPLVAIAGSCASIVSIWPLDVVSFGAVRGAAAVVAAAALLRRCGEGSAAVRKACFWTVAAAAVVGGASFFHFGHPQFFNSGDSRPSYVHQHDMRVYFPQAKYFEELGFDGVYAASVEALSDGEAHMNRRRLGETVMRDLRTHAVVRVRQAEDHIDEVRQRFSPERWDAFVSDMRYFWEAMSINGYLRSMLDHGGNATPVWLANAKLIFSNLIATEETLTATSLLDPLLLGLAFIAIGRSFGVLPALLCLLVFGANDYHMGGGTNWAGATLRHDWLAALLGGIAALGARRWILGGVLLGAATMLRAFPFFTFAGVAMSFAWIAWEERRAGVRAILAATRPHLLVVLSGALAIVVLAVYSAVILSPSAWPAWLHKVGLLSGEAHPNHISLKLLFSFDPLASFQAAEERGMGPDWQTAQAATFARRAIVFYLTASALTGVLMWASRGAPLHRAALLGLLLVIVWLYPANYYLHFVCALPLVGCDADRLADASQFRAAVLVWVSLLALCAAQYFTVATPYLDIHYVQSAVITFVALAGVMAGVLWAGALARGRVQA